MKITKKQLRMLIEQAVVESVTGERMHRCFSGQLVPWGTQECVDDISARMDDARAVRDECDNRTDKRDYYNGVLKVLRRELRDAQKVLGLNIESDQPEDGENILLDDEV